ncbi:MAG TPA: molecular chaperone HtpG, partial [Saprospiraceae bacterium]|nr:molecular chaperone HtpG [Saprospiraceae bacterium]
KIKNQFEIQKNKIHLYSNQVFVTDDVKEIVPEFLMLLHGVIDSPDIPLNVSRSYLQSDANVRKITSYITRKVAEKLHDLFKKDRNDFEKKWDDIGTFIKYGIISDEKFAEKANSFALLKNTKSEYRTIEEYKEKIKDTQTDKNNKLTVIYTNDAKLHYSLIAACEDKGYDVLVMDNIIDNHFIQQLEYKAEMSFKRVDSKTVDNLIEKDTTYESVLSEADQTSIAEIFKGISLNKSTSTELKALSPNDPPIQIIRPEFMRRMSEMQHMMTMMKGEGEEMFKEAYNVIINSNHPVIAQKINAAESAERKSELATNLFELALLDQNMLKGEALSKFVKKSLERI